MSLCYCLKEAGVAPCVGQMKVKESLRRHCCHGQTRFKTQRVISKGEGTFSVTKNHFLFHTFLLLSVE